MEDQSMRELPTPAPVSNTSSSQTVSPEPVSKPSTEKESSAGPPVTKSSVSSDLGQSPSAGEECLKKIIDSWFCKTFCSRNKCAVCMFITVFLGVVAIVVWAVLSSGSGDCILTIADDARVPSNVWTVSDITHSDTCEPFTKYLNVFGMLLVSNTAGQDVPDNGLKWIAKAVTEMFPGDASDQDAQEQVLESMYRYRGSNPVFSPEFVDDQHPARDYLSMCDTITIGFMDGDNPVSENQQIIEVYEHLLHAITAVGLNKAFPDQWGIAETSDLYAAMQEAIEVGAFDDSGYSWVDEETELLRITLTEFAYWGLSTVYGVHETYGEDSAPEWTLISDSEVIDTLPLFWALHEATTATFMAAPSNATMAALGKLAPEQTAEEAQWPIIDDFRGDLTGPIPSTTCEIIW